MTAPFIRLVMKLTIIAALQTAVESCRASMMGDTVVKVLPTCHSETSHKNAEVHPREVRARAALLDQVLQR